MSFFIQCKVYLIPLGMEYNIIQMTVTASFHSMTQFSMTLSHKSGYISAMTRSMLSCNPLIVCGLLA